MNRITVINIAKLISLVFLFSFVNAQAMSVLEKRMRNSHEKLAPACKKLGGDWNKRYKICVGGKRPSIKGLCIDQSVNYVITPICPEDVMSYMSLTEFNNKYGSKKSNSNSNCTSKIRGSNCINPPFGKAKTLAQRCRSMGGTFCKKTKTCTINNKKLSAGCMWVIKNGQLTQACTVDNKLPPSAGSPPSAGTPPFLGKEVDYLLQVEGTAYCERNISKKGEKLKWWCNGPGQNTILADEKDVLKQAKVAGCKYPRMDKSLAWVSPNSKHYGKHNAEGRFFYCGKPMASYDRDIKKYLTLPKSFLKHRKIYGCPYSKWKVPKNMREYYYNKSTCIHIEHLNSGDVSWKTKKIKKKI